MNALEKIESGDALHPNEVGFGMNQAEARIAELAKLSILDYELCRKTEAKSLGMREPILNQLVERKRHAEAVGQGSNPSPKVAPWEEVVTPWTEEVNGADLLTEIQTVIERFCVLPEHSAPLIAAWVLHAWAHDAFDISPILALISPEKGCGKTTVLTIIGALVPRPMPTVNITAAALFRGVEKYSPTVLIDEGDTFLAHKEDLRGILNGGHARWNSHAMRVYGENHDVGSFNVWCPKAIAMIGKLPDTLEDRSLVVPLRRKLAGDRVARFRGDRDGSFLVLRRKAARWAQDNMGRLREMEPKVPDLLINRAQDNAFAICAIGDAAGGKWPEIIRAALIGIAAQRDDEQQSAGVLLLRDIAAIFDSKGVTQIGSSELCAELCELEESPWAELRHGASITTHGIAKRLKPFGIRPRRERRGSAYHLADFKDALERYVPADPEKSAASATTATHQNRDDGSGVATDCRETTTQDNPTHWDEFEGEL